MKLTPDETAAIARAEVEADEAQRAFDAAAPGSEEAFRAAPKAVNARRQADEIRQKIEYAASCRALGHNLEEQ